MGLRTDILILSITHVEAGALIAQSDGRGKASLRDINATWTSGNCRTPQV